MFEDIDLHLLLTGGRKTPLPVARLDHDLCKIIGASTNTVVITPYTARKQRYKHGDSRHLQIPHYRMIQAVLNFGEAIHKPDRPKHLEFVHIDTAVFETNFIAIVKANGAGDELFLESFRKLETRRFNSRIRKAHKSGHVVRYIK